jgi:hypothetical protein
MSQSERLLMVPLPDAGSSERCRLTLQKFLLFYPLICPFVNLRFFNKHLSNLYAG